MIYLTNHETSLSRMILRGKYKNANFLQGIFLTCDEDNIQNFDELGKKIGSTMLTWFTTTSDSDDYILINAFLDKMLNIPCAGSVQYIRAIQLKDLPDFVTLVFRYFYCSYVESKLKNRKFYPIFRYYQRTYVGCFCTVPGSRQHFRGGIHQGVFK
jgi:hypothetical protein